MFESLILFAFFIFAFFSTARNLMPSAYNLGLRIIRLIPKILLWILVGKTQPHQTESRKKQRGAQRHTLKPRSKRR